MENLVRLKFCSYYSTSMCIANEYINECLLIIDFKTYLMEFNFFLNPP
jgi:hypothetical protein